VKQTKRRVVQILNRGGDIMRSKTLALKFGSHWDLPVHQGVKILA
jgi:hypothetical protein